MHVLNIRNLKGISSWSSSAALHATIGGVPDGTVSAEQLLLLQSRLERLCVPPHLAKAVVGRRSPDASPPTAGELAVDLAGELQYLCGEFHGTHRAWPLPSQGVWKAVLECCELASAEACLRASIEILNTLLLGANPDIAAAYSMLLATAGEVCSVSSPGLVVSAARDRRIPVFRLGPDFAFSLAPDQVLQLGEGIHQRRLHPWGTMTDRTGYLAGHLANDKAFVKSLWAQYGIPVAAGRIVTDAEDAVQAAAALGGSVVVKAVDADCGSGMTIRPSSPEAISAAFHKAKAASTSGTVLLERYLPGTWHRLLYIDQRLVAALRRTPASVVGDGEHTIRELVELANRNARRGPDDRWPLRFLSLDETELEVLAESGVTPDTVVPCGERIDLRITASAAAGAESFDVTDDVHPETRELALDAVRLLGLDIAGLDLVATDIRRPLREQQGGFLEINEQPAIFIHAAPLCSPPRPVGEAIIESLFPGGRTGRVPLVAIVGGQLADQTAVSLATSLAGQGRVVGLSTPTRTQLGSRNITPPNTTLPDRLEILLRHPRTEMAIVSASLRELLDSGLGADHCSVVVLVDGLPNIKDVETAQDVDRFIGRLLAVADRSVVNIQDSTWKPWIATGSPDVCLVGTDAAQPSLGEHLAAGGIAAILDPEWIVIQTGGRQTQFFPAARARDNHRVSRTGALAHALATAARVSLIRALGTVAGETETYERPHRTKRISADAASRTKSPRNGVLLPKP